MSEDPSTVPHSTGAAEDVPSEPVEQVVHADHGGEHVSPESVEHPAVDEYAADEYDESEPVPAPSSVAAATAESRPRALALLIGLGVLVLGLLVGIVLGGKAWMDRRDAADSERAAVATGRQGALNVFSFDYRKVEDQLKVIQGEAGGRFATEFTNSRDALIKVVKAEERVSSSRVVEVAVVTAGPKSVQILVALNEFRVTKANPKGVPILQRVFLELRKTSGHWKLVDLRPVA